MTRVSVVMLTCWLHLVLAAPLGAQQGLPYQQIDTPQGKMTVFDGKQHPETIPAYLLWREAFQTLDLAKRKHSIAIPNVLVLSDADAALVYGEARAQVARLARCTERQVQEQTTLKETGQDWKAIYKATQAIDYECRVEVIEARDRLLAALSPEGAVALTTWVDGRRQAIKVLVPVGEIESFKRPQ